MPSNTQEPTQRAIQQTVEAEENFKKKCGAIDTKVVGVLCRVRALGDARPVSSSPWHTPRVHMIFLLCYTETAEPAQQHPGTKAKIDPAEIR